MSAMMHKSSSRSALLAKLALASVVCLGLAVGLRCLPGTKAAQPAAAWLENPLILHFAIADWDGDRKPDVAFVETADGRSSPSNYSIRVRLSGGLESAIGVSAPSGGLRLTARDVNGDDNVDLVVRAVFDAHFLTVLLSDGHGHFSVAKPGSYPAITDEEDVFLQGPAGSPEQISVAQTRTTSDGDCIAGSAKPAVTDGDSVGVSKSRVALSSSRQTNRGRAPPPPVSFG
jgi:hypothetical protein